MEEDKFNRQAFVKQRSEPPRTGSSMAGPLFLVALVCLVGFGGYMYVKAYGLPAGIPEIGGADPQLALIAEKLEEIETRLVRMENRQKVSPSPAPAAEKPALTNTPASVSPSSSPSQLPAMSKQTPDSSAAPSPIKEAPLLSLQQELSSVQSDIAANQEAWEATTDRLGDAVGELDSQRSEITNTRENLDQFQKSFERTSLPFQLHRKGGRRRIGPIWLELKKVDRKKQRYTMQVLLNDKWIEMKDRVLGERVEFYSSGIEYPLELVVSEILKDQVAGHLVLPKEVAQKGREALGAFYR